MLVQSHSNNFSHHASFFRNSVFLFLFLSVFLILNLNSCKRSNNECVLPFLVAVLKAWLAKLFYSLLLLLIEDVQLNPGSKLTSSNSFSDLSLEFKQYICSQLCPQFSLRFDIIFLPEIYLYSSTPSNDSNLEISGYTFKPPF